jgi:sterol desaturase/sphingolipid hydroxylase (fatty acid hydroxylase superfamily)
MFILAWLAKIGIGSIANKLAAAYAAKQNATTDQARIAADERIRTLEAKRDVQVAEAGSPINAFIRVLFALPVAIYYGKLFLYDKVLAMGATDPLSSELTQIAFVIIGFYFVDQMVARIKR